MKILLYKLSLSCGILALLLGIVVLFGWYGHIPTLIQVHPISGRLMAVADVYDALTSKRVYKPPFSHEKAVEIILENKGKHFDPDIVDAFIEIENTFRKIALKFNDPE